MSNRSGSWEIWLCDSEGRNARPLTSFPEASVTGSPRWSPDGRQIAFDSWEKGRSNVFVVSRGGRVATLSHRENSRWLPAELVEEMGVGSTSARIAAETYQIWRMPAEGGAGCPGDEERWI